jgi:hypothetical protein
VDLLFGCLVDIMLSLLNLELDRSD